MKFKLTFLDGDEKLKTALDTPGDEGVGVDTNE